MSWCRLFLAVALCLSVARAAVPRPRTARGPARGPAGDASYRLPGEATPIHYDIKITPHLNSFTFDGEVDITFKVVKTSSSLTLHADQLDLSACTVDGTAVTATPDATRQFIAFSVNLQANDGVEHKLSCKYSGKIHDDDKGFYRSSYYDKEDLKWLGITQFEMTFARRAFPCFDEPGYRATFTLSMVHPQSLSVVSNTRIASKSRPGTDDLITTTFETTPAMATYTLAWMVSELPSVSDGEVEAFSTYAQPSQLGRTELSQEVGPQVLSLMEEYTGIQYKLDKMDQVAVPDHNFGAMENWGLVTYRQALLLSDSSSRSMTNLSVTTTIAHELAHQWFGNLVTPSWWSHVWLSEAFAELFCYIVTDAIFPSWNVMDKMSVLEMQKAFVEDSLASSSPMNKEVFTPDEILSNFGDITYAKGSSVLRMLQDAITPDTFQSGVQLYLRKLRQTGTARPEDLWGSLEQAVSSAGSPLPAGTTITDIGKSWTDQPGYPVINVARTGSSLQLTQERFLSAGQESTSSSASWLVPVSLRWGKADGSESDIQQAFLTTTSQVLPLQDLQPDAKWILINAEQIGYYRVNYDSANWQALTAELQDPDCQLLEADRAMLVDDALNLARAGRLGYDASLSVVEYLSKGEQAYAPWGAGLDELQYLATQLRDGEFDATCNLWIQLLTEQTYKQLGFNKNAKEQLDQMLSRSVVTQLALEAKLNKAVQDAKTAYNSWLNGKSVDADTVRLALCQGMQEGNAATYADLFTRLLDSDDEAARSDITYALGCAPQTNTLKLKEQLIKDVIAGSGLRVKDALNLWKSVSSTPVGLSLALDNAIASSSSIIATFGVSHFSSVISTLASRIISNDNYNKLKTFAGSDDVAANDLKDVVAAALASADANLAWRSAHYTTVVQHIKEALNPTPPPPATTPSPIKPTTVTMSPPVTAAPTPPSPSPAGFRLPADLVPQSYALTITPVLEGTEKNTFKGSVVIKVSVAKSTASIILHSVDLQFKIGDVKVTNANGGDSKIKSVDFSPHHDFVTITLNSALDAGKSYSIAISYQGPLRNDLTGLYVSTLRTGKNAQRLIGAQLYPAYARRMLPCFDEPAYRAPFQLSVVREASETAVSNAAVLDTSDPDPALGNRVTDVFEMTESIPVSRVGLVVAPLDFVLSDDGYTTVYGQPSTVTLVQQDKDTFRVEKLIRQWLQKRTGVLPGARHLNIVALTNSLSDASASWGLITMREEGIANLNKSPSSGESEQTYLTQLARYLAQLWFGDLVTFDWWGNAWLSEGLSTYYQYKGAAWVEISYKLLDQLYTRGVSPALYADSFEGARPLSNNEGVDGSQDSVSVALDVITKGKGCGVFQMLQLIVGQDTLDSGLQNYFNASGLGVGTPDGLFSAVQQEITPLSNALPDDVTLTDVMKTWVDYGGYPVVTVIRDYDNMVATVTQERFLSHAASSADLQGKWWIPLTYALRHDYYSEVPESPVKIWMAPGESVQIELKHSDEWLLVNQDRRGFYRVNYDIKNWILLKNYMNEFFSVMEPLGRAMLVDDAPALARAGRLDYSVALNFMDYLRIEIFLVPWEAARQSLDHLGSQFYESPYEEGYKAWLLEITEKSYRYIGFNPISTDVHSERLLRAIMTIWVCELDDKNCNNYATQNFADWLKDPNSVGHDTLAASVCSGVRADATALEKALAGLAAEREDSSRAAIIEGLGCVRSEAQVNKLLGLTRDSAGGLRKDEAALLWKSVTRFGPTAVSRALAFFSKNAQDIINVSGRYNAFSIFFKLADRVTTSEQYTVLSQLVAAVDPSQQRVQGALRIAEGNIQWRKDNLQSVADVLYSLTSLPHPGDPTTPNPVTTKPTGPPVTITDPPTRVPSSSPTFWTLPTTGPTTPVTLPTLPPRTSTGTPGAYTDPPTRVPSSKPTDWTLPPTGRPTKPATLPPLTTANPVTKPPVTQPPVTRPQPIPTTQKPNSASSLTASAIVAVMVAVLTTMYGGHC